MSIRITFCSDCSPFLAFHPLIVDRPSRVQDFSADRWLLPVPYSRFATAVDRFSYSISESSGLKTVCLDIKNAADGWVAIRDRVVRGAPAIGISAALSLAVKVSDLEDCDGSSDAASSFLFKKLEYILSSRPTAVNLQDAASKLKKL